MIRRGILFVVGLIIGILPLSRDVHAQFIGISVDAAIAYSVAIGDVTGGSVGITHPVPLIPNIGAMALSFGDDEQLNNEYELNTRVSMRSIEFFYHVPFPVVTIALGFGGGLIDVNTDIIHEGEGTVESVNFTAPIAEGFVRIGLQFAHVFEFHIGIHGVSISEVDRVQDSKTDLSGLDTMKDYSGTMGTISIQLAF